MERGMRLRRGGTWVDGNVSREGTETEAREHLGESSGCDFFYIYILKGNPHKEFEYVNT